jgi:tRNA-specific 2-thiouridylase
MKTRTRVVVAMSGGVDSSVAAALLVEQGCEVIGLMMRLWSEPGKEAYNRCCTPDAMGHARHIAESLDIPFYVVDTKDIFHDTIVNFFIDGYASGVTPNPCLECNRHIRWEFLLNKALSLGADYLATGHYARVRAVADGPITNPTPLRSGDCRYQLLKSVDDKKDQSYVLSVMGQAQLRHAMFPVGGYTKTEIRELARKFNLPVAERPDSQDLCFLSDNDYRRFLTEHAPQVAQPGPILDSSGKVLGQHQGLAFYTIGQRKGIGLAAREPLYVLGTDPVRNALVVGVEAELGQTTMRVARINWVSGVPPVEPFEADIKIRYKAMPRRATITPLDSTRAGVTFEEPVRDITPGQGAVFYDGDVCLGGGIIQR